ADGKTLNKREGLLVGLRSASGAEGWGEIAPLEALFSESNLEARERSEFVLKRWTDSIQRSPGADDFTAAAFGKARFLEDAFWKELLPDFKKVPSVRCGFEMAFSSLAAAEQRIPVRTWINKGASHSAVKTSLLLEAGSESFLDEGTAAYARGFRVFKVKIARAEAHLEQESIRCLAERFPDIRLRLDANRHLNDAAFKEWLAASARWPVEYWEEPFQDEAALDRFEAPFAVDESLRGVTASAPQNVWEAELDKLPKTIEVWIVKPAMLGSLKSLFFLSELAVKKKKKLVLSSTFETRLGLSFWAEGSAVLEKSSGGMVSGLGTLDYFSRDLCLPEKDRAEPDFQPRPLPFSSADLNVDLVKRLL
ncbi:MAG: o-succinylbenzoate synthase, partial [Spirochaetia bacterium]|nr:o-succinylbenzoate synthase [Spirochaetia bacterium]